MVVRVRTIGLPEGLHLRRELWVLLCSCRLARRCFRSRVDSRLQLHLPASTTFANPGFLVTSPQKFYGWKLIGVLFMLDFLNLGFPFFGGAVISTYMLKQIPKAQAMVCKG
jgi:hypothetical protein